MAYATGTATDRNDLWTKLLAFLTTNSTLVAANQQWEVVWSRDAAGSTMRMLKGRGLTGTDEVFVSLWKQDDALTTGESVVWIGGATGVSASATSILGHPNALARYPAMFLDSGPMQYWFIANGRRFIVVTKISTVYNAMYGGLMLQYSIPNAYKYPLFVGGSRGNTIGTNFTVNTWRAPERLSYSSFAKARGDTRAPTQSPQAYYDPPAQLLDPAGLWKPCFAAGNSANSLRVLMYPTNQQTTLGDQTNNDPDLSALGNGKFGLGYASIQSRLVEGLDGSVPLTPITLAEASTASPAQPTLLGILDGVYSVAALSPTAESIVTAGGVNHLVVQDISRTASDTYWAVALN